MESLNENDLADLPDGAGELMGQQVHTSQVEIPDTPISRLFNARANPIGGAVFGDDGFVWSDMVQPTHYNEMLRLMLVLFTGAYRRRGSRGGTLEDLLDFNGRDLSSSGLYGLRRPIFRTCRTLW